MGLSRIYSRALKGLDAPLVTIEVHVSGGLPAFNLVGLPEGAVREARDRVRSAIQNSGFEFPASRITINLAPADLPKEGAGYDLPMALGILAATGQLNVAELDHLEVLGELALNGQVRAVRGALPIALSVQKDQRAMIMPSANAQEAALVEGFEAYVADHLVDVVAALNGGKKLALAEAPELDEVGEQYPDMQDVKGQQQAKRALMVAAAGGHNILMEGPPGSGKSMLAKRLPGILPPLSRAEALEVAAIGSLLGEPLVSKRFAARPYRVVHNSASIVALLGGGNGKPGEVSRAHHGLLFCDESTEFPRKSLEALRDPIENGYIDISRAAFKYRYPAKFQLVMAMNPCPCGDPDNCRDTPDQISRYRSKLSGPILDRIDVHLRVPRVKQQALTQQAANAENSLTMQALVLQARERQLQRQGKANAWLSAAEIEQHAKLQPAAQTLLNNAIDKMGLTARGYHRVLKVARSVADLAGSVEVDAMHMAEAISYRQMDAWRKPA